MTVHKGNQAQHPGQSQALSTSAKWENFIRLTLGTLFIYGTLYTYTGFVNQLLTVTCAVRANPAQGLVFYWSFNSSVESYEQNVSCGVVWCGMVRYGMLRYGMVRYGMLRYGMVWYGTVGYCMVGYDMVWYGMVRYGMVWYGVVRYGRVWYGMVWYGMLL